MTSWAVKGRESEVREFIHSSLLYAQGRVKYNFKSTHQNTPYGENFWLLGGKEQIMRYNTYIRSGFKLNLFVTQQKTQKHFYFYTYTSCCIILTLLVPFLHLLDVLL